MVISGIYKIINIETKDFYVGSSKNILKRWWKHKYELNKNIHHSIILQRAWNKYGSKSFKFEIIEECDPNILLIKEQVYLDDNPTYNVGKIACGGDNLTNNPNRDNIIKNMSKIMIQRFKNMSDDEKKSYSDSLKGENNPNYNNNWSDDMKKEQSSKLKKYFETHTNYISGKTFDEFFGEEKANDIKKKISDAASKRVGEKNSFYGKKHSNETKDKISKIKKGTYNGSQNLPFSIDGVEYTSLGEASKKLEIPIPTIRWRIKSNNIKFINYKYII